jgi:hypothetical protein
MMRSNPPTDFDLQEKVRRELEIDETIQWIDMPVPRFFTPFSIGAFLFAIPWTGFAVFWTFGAAGFTIPDFSEGLSGVDFFPLFGLPFILIGIGLLTTPIRTYWRALKTVYVITDQRAITIQGGRTTVVRSFPPRDLQNIFRKEKRDGTGDVIITQGAVLDSSNNKDSEPLGFLQIRNPREVERMLKKLAAEAGERKDW